MRLWTVPIYTGEATIKLLSNLKEKLNNQEITY